MKVNSTGFKAHELRKLMDIYYFKVAYQLKVKRFQQLMGSAHNPRDLKELERVKQQMDLLEKHIAEAVAEVERSLSTKLNFKGGS